MKKQLLSVSLLFLTIASNAQNIKSLVLGNNGVTKHFTILKENEKIPFTTNLKSLLGLPNESELVLAKTEPDNLGYTHYRYNQTYRGIPVEHSMYIVQTKQNRIEKLSGEIILDFTAASRTSGTAKINAQTAFDIAVHYVGAKEYAWQDVNTEKIIKMQTGNRNASHKPVPVLIWYNAGNSLDAKKLRLAYKADVYALQPLSHAWYYIDAQNGDVLGKEDIIRQDDAAGTAETFYSGTQTIHSSLKNALYYLRDSTKGKGIITLHGESGKKGQDYTNNSANWSLAGTDVAALDVHFGVAATYTFYKNTFNRNSYDNAGTALLSYVNIGAFDNAFWDGYAMNFDRSSTSPGGTTAIDITGHELTHAVTQTTCDLNYSYEPGAINESLSDIMGKSVQFYTKPDDISWNMGNDMNLALRDMSNPNLYECPDTYKGKYWYTSDDDNGGVHYNSGVGNFFFYLLVTGGSGTNDNGDAYNVTGIGLAKADQIIYRTQTAYLIYNSNYQDWRTACISAATDLYGEGSDEVVQVENAWSAVGVGSQANTITTNALSDNVFCPGTDIGISFTASGTFKSDNTFTAQLSDTSGSFLHFTDLGTLQSATPGTISVVISGTIPRGNKYRIRVTSTSPLVTGTDNGTNLSIGPYTEFYRDTDGDGFGDNNHVMYTCGAPQGYSIYGNDCNDNNAAINPNTVWITDQDNDGYYPDNFYQQCASPGPGWIIRTNQQPGDCNDNDAAINPNTLWIIDNDNDGYSPVDWVKQCESPGPGWIIRINQGVGDCDDNDPTVHPFAPELCDGKDNNCNGVIDEGVKTEYYRDADGDGFGDFSNGVLTCSAPEGYVTTGGDCNDSDAAINPNTLWIIDNDNDGYSPVDWVKQCESPGPGWIIRINQGVGDCDDNDPAVHPFAPELCDGKDNNCNGVIDEGVKTEYYRDADGDGYGDYSTGVLTCSAPEGYVTTGGDCNDSDAAINPNTLWIIDNDNDGYSPVDWVKQCESPGPGWIVRINQGVGDCDDNDPAVHPFAPELCDGKDNNCNGVIDEGVKTEYYRDADGDGFGDYSNGILTCSAPEGYVTTGGDCDDTKKSVHPGAKEICGDGIDNNCDGQIDENCSFACSQTATNTNTTNITPGSATLNWSAAVNPNRWQIRYKKTGTGIPWIPVIVAGPSRSFTISPLDANQKYVWKIRAQCNGGIVTNYTVNTSFKTLKASKLFVSSSQTDGKLKNAIGVSVKVFPNPAQNMLVVELKGFAEHVSIQLQNPEGEILNEEKIQMTSSTYAQRQINVTDIANGIYFLLVTDNKGNMQTEKVIVSR